MDEITKGPTWLERPEVDYRLIIGVAHVTLYLRHAQSLKEKRRALTSVIERLKKQGFSVTECAYHDNPKRGSVGMTFVGRDQGVVEKTLDEALALFQGDLTPTATDRDVFDYSFLREEGRVSADGEDPEEWER